MKEKIKKYLPDILIIIGVLTLSYNILIPPSGVLSEISLVNRHIKEKVFGIFLILVGTDMAIRKYLSFKHKNKFE